MGCRHGDPAKFGNLHPATSNSRRRIPAEIDRGMNHVAGEGIANFIEERAAGPVGQGGEKVEALPAALGVVLGKPDFPVPLGNKNILALDCGSRLQAGSGGGLMTGRAGPGQGAGVAAWTFWKAHQGPQFHQGLVVEAGVFPWNKTSGQGTQTGQIRRLAVSGGKPAQYPGHIPVKSRGRLTKGNAGNRPCGVVADSGQGAKRLRLGRKFFCGKPDHRLGQCVEKARAPVVPEPLP